MKDSFWEDLDVFLGEICWPVLVYILLCAEREIDTCFLIND